ncbi:glycosyltransferase family 2 protein [Shewanella pneumatophori]|uniref:Glycosyltransferase family 2 protein n=1 Tax=Shewanella pneumatophori TaxID=314092 RepID=A0A9X2CIL4_9GAMM|nr:glycosyltransferase family 2 protein [Shewanella pneumatophori]MCL1139579.1 glycosyltransferase family 2 protein [Shewanella pneumatophori]
MNAIAIVVTYHPDVDRLLNLVSSLKEQGLSVVIVDNSIDIVENFFKIENVKVIANKKNLGIAKAQNIGIKYALDSQAKFICFFDQDSYIPSNYAAGLINNRCSNASAVYLPLVIDEDSGEELPAFKLNKIGIPKKVFSNGQEKEFLVELAISSGTVVTAQTFSTVGDMNEDLFIDLVDFDWCFKCLKCSIPITCVTSVIMKHSIGLKKGPITGIIHNPIRNYYKQRNPFYLLAYNYVPKSYALYLILVSTLQSLIMIISQKQSKAYLDSLVAAVRDGFKYLVNHKNGS